MKVAGQRTQWLINTAVLTTSGAITSLMLGLLLGHLGGAIVPDWLLAWGKGLIVLLAVACLLRELEVVRIPLPTVHRQTNDRWLAVFGPRRAAFLWGADIGATVTTRATFSGVWILIAVAIVWQQPFFSGLLLLAYWAGRTLSIWLAPIFVRDARDVGPLLIWLDHRYRTIRLTHALAVASLAAPLAYRSISHVLGRP